MFRWAMVCVRFCVKGKKTPYLILRTFQGIKVNRFYWKEYELWDI